MKILKEREALLSNAEVYNHIKHQSQSYTIVHEMNLYFEKCNTQATAWDKMTIAKVLSGLKEFELTKSEKLQLINFVPKSLPECHCIIEECEERFKQEQVEEIIGLLGCNKD